MHFLARSSGAIKLLNMRITLLVILMLVAGCSRPSAVVYQNATIDALLDGNYDGDLAFRDLRRHGDFGLGTFNGVDGEMVALDGKFYQIRSDGRARRVDDELLTPFSAVTYFKPDGSYPLVVKSGYPQLQSVLDGVRLSQGRPCAIRVDGHFTRVKVRSVPKQSPPYLPLAAVVKGQSEFTLKEVDGTLVGFWFPESMRHLNVPGYHFHFITADRTAGGHVLDLQLENGTVLSAEMKAVELAPSRRAPMIRKTAGGGELDKVEK